MFGFRKKKKHHKAVNVPMFANNIICKGNNDIQIAENQNIEIFLEGENNQIVIAPRAGDISGKICICVYGDNNRITICENNIFEGLFMIVGQITSIMANVIIRLLPLAIIMLSVRLKLMFLTVIPLCLSGMTVCFQRGLFYIIQTGIPFWMQKAAKY